VILDSKLPFAFHDAVRTAAQALLNHPPKLSVPSAQELQALDFILDRAKYVFREKYGFAYDEVNAVFRSGVDDLIDARRRLEALKNVRKSKNFEPLAVSFKRIRKIIEKANLKIAVSVNPELFENDAERELFKSGREAATRVQTEKRNGHYDRALDQIAGLRNSIDRFFNEVMVMAENESVRNNRLALLSELLREFTTIADFSEIGADEK
jgi:glycyl-tRNA synthetase beta chain